MHCEALHRTLVLSGVLGVACITSTAIAADQQAEGIALVRHAVELTDLRQSGPYRLRWKLAVKDPALHGGAGTDVVTFSSVERWRRDLHVGDYIEAAVFLGRNMYRTRSLPYTPPSLRSDLGGSLRNLPELLNYKVVRLFNRKISGVETNCVHLRQPGEDRPGEVVWCFDFHTGLPAAHMGARGGARVEFGDYKAFGSKFIPGTIERIGGKYGERIVLEGIDANVIAGDHAFEPLAAATARPWCDDMEQPRPISLGKAIDIPPSVRMHSGLELNYELSIDEHGNVTDVIPMDAKPFVDRIVIEALRAGKWNPALCSGTPVPTDISFDLPRAFGW